MNVLELNRKDRSTALAREFVQTAFARPATTDFSNGRAYGYYDSATFLEGATLPQAIMRLEKWRQVIRILS